MSQPVIIFGAGGFAREVLQVILDINEVSQTWEPVGFWIEPDFSAPEEIHGLPVFTKNGLDPTENGFAGGDSGRLI